MLLSRCHPKFSFKPLFPYSILFLPRLCLGLAKTRPWEVDNVQIMFLKVVFDLVKDIGTSPHMSGCSSSAPSPSQTLVL